MDRIEEHVNLFTRMYDCFISPGLTPHCEGLRNLLWVIFICGEFVTLILVVALITSLICQ